MSKLTCRTEINAPRKEVWNKFTQPKHVTNWYYADPSWHAPSATNDLKPGGEFSIRMEQRTGSSGFDFTGTYTEVKDQEHIAYAITDGRQVDIDFSESNGKTTVVENFATENANADKDQHEGWQAILDNFKKYCEGDLT